MGTLVKKLELELDPLIIGSTIELVLRPIDELIVGVEQVDFDV